MSGMTQGGGGGGGPELTHRNAHTQQTRFIVQSMHFTGGCLVHLVPNTCCQNSILAIHTFFMLPNWSLSHNKEPLKAAHSLFIFNENLCSWLQDDS